MNINLMIASSSWMSRLNVLIFFSSARWRRDGLYFTTIRTTGTLKNIIYALPHLQFPYFHTDWKGKVHTSTILPSFINKDNCNFPTSGAHHSQYTTNIWILKILPNILLKFPRVVGATSVPYRNNFVHLQPISQFPLYIVDSASMFLWNTCTRICNNGGE